MNKNTFQKIISLNNIKEGYLDFIEKIEKKGKSPFYTGISGLKIDEINHVSNKICREIRKEIIELKPIAPAICHYIPKKDGSLRDIYVYDIKDRIKAQAIYRVLEPIFEEEYSSFLFSYRSSANNYYAARSVVRRYLRHYQEDFVLVADLKNYSNFIDQKILLKKLNQLKLDPKIIKVLNLFITNSVYKDKKIYHPTKGVIQGVPLIALFANLYLNDLDKYLGPKVSLYRRVGDDLILFDKNKDKLLELKDYLNKEIKNLKLEIKEKKTKLLTAKEKFNFLGYSFCRGIISMEPEFIKKNITYWKKLILSHQAKNEIIKENYLKKILFGQKNNINNQFKQIVWQKILINNDQQMKNFSDNFFRIITKYFFGKYSFRNQRLLKKRFKNIEIPSLYKIYLNSKYYYGKKRSSNIFIPKKKRN